MANQTIYPFGTDGSLPSGYPIIDDLVTGGADKALSAEQGKEIGTALYGGITKKAYTIDYQNASGHDGIILAENKWYDSAYYKCAIIAVVPGETYRFISGTNNVDIAVLKTDNYANNTTPDFCDDYPGRIVAPLPETLVIPSDAHYLYVRKNNSAGSCNTTVLRIDDVTVDGAFDKIGEVQAKVDLTIDGRGEVNKKPDWSPGYVKGSNGEVVSSSLCSFSQPIFLKAGEAISYKTGDVFGRAVVEVSDDSSVEIGDVLSGNVLINYQAAGTVVEYTTDTDIYIVVSILNNDYDVSFFESGPSLQACTFNSSYNKEDTTSKREEFCGMIKGTDKVETFLFFTDPHLTDYSRYEDMDELVRDKYISTLQKYYNSLPLDYCICGGDWLNDKHSDAEACAWLGYCDAYMRKLFKNYFPVFGNHDCNPYKYGVDHGTFPYSDGWPYALDYNTIKNLVFRENGGAYYSFDGINTKFYVINSGVSFIKGMTDSTYSYLLDDRWAQVDWFGQKLLTDDPDNAIVISHIYSNANNESEWNSASSGYWAKGPHALSRNIRDLAIAYNNRRSITKNGITYDFSGCTGRVALYICGHTHFDFVDAYDELPVVCITDLEGGHFVGGSLIYELIPTFDCCLVDYDNDKFKTVRVGAGVSRIVNFTPISVSAGNTYTLTSELSGTLTWATQNSAKATVNSGVVTAVASGCAGIIATDENGKQEYWIIKVE